MSEFSFTDPSESSLRWSDTVPPDSALTFAIIIDDEDDPVGFSGAEFHRSSRLVDRAKSSDSPLDVASSDSQSQTLALLTPQISDIPTTAGLASSALGPNSSTLAFFRDNHSLLFSDPSPSILGGFGEDDRFLRPYAAVPRTQASSTMGGVDVYHRDSVLLERVNTIRSRHFSCFDSLDDNFAFDPRTSFYNRVELVYDGHDAQSAQSIRSITDEGYSERCIHPLSLELLDNAETDPSISTGGPSSILAPSPDSTLAVAEQDDWGWKPQQYYYPVKPEPNFAPQFRPSHAEFKRRRLQKARPSHREATFVMDEPIQEGYVHVLPPMEEEEYHSNGNGHDIDSVDLAVAVEAPLPPLPPPPPPHDEVEDVGGNSDVQEPSKKRQSRLSLTSVVLFSRRLIKSVKKRLTRSSLKKDPWVLVNVEHTVKVKQVYA